MKTIGFFNNKGGVGKTTLVYHLAWMMSLLGRRVIAVDLDPQANVTSMFCTADELEGIWAEEPRRTMYGIVAQQFRGIGDIIAVEPLVIADGLGLVPGDLELSRTEDDLATSWTKCGDGDERAFRVTSSFARAIASAGARFRADVALVDVGPNLGALNRAALLACDFIVVPVGADLFSLQGLRNMGPTLRNWRTQWSARKQLNPEPNLNLPAGEMAPLGYVVMRHSVRAGEAARAYGKWIERMPAQYSAYVLHQPIATSTVIEDDPSFLAQLRDYRSLMPMAQEARKPMFLLRPADGAFGGHQAAVEACRTDFKELTTTILAAANIVPLSA
jgi:cellulose biosynthesis protein BcsQ